MIELLWSKLPGFLKWPLIIGAILALLPLKVYEGARGFVHSEVHAIILPIEEKRDIQFSQLKSDVESIKQDTRDIKFILMERGSK